MLFYTKTSTFAGMNQEPFQEEPMDAVEEESLDLGEELFERVNLVVDRKQEPLRIDRFLTQRLPHVSRNKIQQAAEQGMVLVNGKPSKSNYKIRPGDQIVLYTFQESPETEIIPEHLPLDIVYEDEDLMVIHKDAGMVVHPGSGNYRGTLVNGLAGYLYGTDAQALEGVIPRVGLVHRIDKNTSGLLVIGKTEQAMNHLANQFFDHSVTRRYVALVWGDLAEDEGTVRAHIGRHHRFRKKMDAYPDGDYGKEAVTHYKVLERFHYVSLIECRLETGRTHQIRVHMQHIGHPLFNDDTYGGDRIVKGTIFSKYKQFVQNAFEIMPYHALHAQSLGFIHPRTRQPMYFERELPARFQEVIAKWRHYVAHIKVNLDQHSGA